MTLAELCAYLGHMTSEEVIAHILAKKLPPPAGGFGVKNAGARWDQSEVDRALDATRKKTRGR